MESKQLKRIYNSLKNNTVIEDACEKLGVASGELCGLIEFMQLEGLDISIIDEDGELLISKKINSKKTNHVKDNKDELEEVYLGVITDTHLCSTVQQLTLVNEFYTECHRRGIKTILHCGDVLDGDYTKIRPDQNYSLFRRGFDEQTEYVIDMYPRVEGTTTHFIDGTHDLTHLKNGGAIPGKWISKLRDDMVYLGAEEYLFKAGTNKNLTILMKHPGGGVAKAYSYKLQEAINKMTPGVKPKILLHGHFHKNYYMFYRNVHAFSLPCMCAKSSFMTRMDIPNIVGAYFLRMFINKKGEIQYIEPEEYLFKDSQIREDDYIKCKKLVIKK